MRGSSPLPVVVETALLALGLRVPCEVDLVVLGIALGGVHQGRILLVDLSVQLPMCHLLSCFSRLALQRRNKGTGSLCNNGYIGCLQLLVQTLLGIKIT
jgi:hypothetical protein